MLAMCGICNKFAFFSDISRPSSTLKYWLTPFIFHKNDLRGEFNKHRKFHLNSFYTFVLRVLKDSPFRTFFQAACGIFPHKFNVCLKKANVIYSHEIACIYSLY